MHQNKNFDPRALNLLEAVTRRGKTIESLSLDILIEHPTLKVQNQPLRISNHLDFKRPCKYRSIRYDKKIAAVSNNGNHVQFDTAKKTYTTSPLSKISMASILPYLDGWDKLHDEELEVLKYLGTEKLSGITCDVLKAEIYHTHLKGELYHTHDEGSKMIETNHLYVNPERIICRVHTSGEKGRDIFQCTYSNIVLNPNLPESFFLLPQGYSRVLLPTERDIPHR